MKKLKMIEILDIDLNSDTSVIIGQVKHKVNELVIAVNAMRRAENLRRKKEEDNKILRIGRNYPE
jgi:hypothetical protein